MGHFYWHRFSQLNDSCFLKESDWLVYRIDWTFGIILYLWNKTNRLIVRIHTNKSAPFSHWLNIMAEVALGPKILEVPSPQTHVPLPWKIVTWPTSDETTVVTYTVTILTTLPQWFKQNGIYEYMSRYIYERNLWVYVFMVKHRTLVGIFASLSLLVLSLAYIWA